MTRIYLQTIIQAPKEKVFDASRNLDLHQRSLVDTQEQIIAGRTSGLIEKGETVTWRAKHFGVYLTHESLITELVPYQKFTDVMRQGHFKHFEHQHYFFDKNGATLMIDAIEYSVPYGWLGNIFDKCILRNYLTKLMERRNLYLNDYLENSFQSNL
ncbi:SRPBCC family protein [Flavobacterium sp.]|uniref:SRPBCC family protein n=1 Tax=Flavobacterium sp. TaxID=239 RepID=UPI003D1463C8